MGKINSYAFSCYSNVGYTLIELLVVIGLAAVIIFVAALPQIRSITSILELQVASNQVAQELLLAQRLAVMRQSAVKLEAVPRTLLSPAKCKLIYAGLVSQKNLPGGISFSGHLNFTFAGSGFPVPGGTGTLVISNRLGKTKQIVVSSVGRVRVQ